MTEIEQGPLGLCPKESNVAIHVEEANSYRKKSENTLGVSRAQMFTFNLSAGFGWATSGQVVNRVPD